jgi:signal transduction histidine kinase
MARTLDTLIAAARAQLDPRRGSSDAAAAVRAVVEADHAASPQAPRVTVAGAVAAPLRVAVEQALVERILAPVIENARRHAVSGVELGLAREDGIVTITVSDDGSGVAPEELEAIFEPGRRAAGGASTAVSTGAGLGLALARRLARSAGGDVRALSGERGGVFLITLPAAPAP